MAKLIAEIWQERIFIGVWLGMAADSVAGSALTFRELLCMSVIAAASVIAGVYASRFERESRRR